MATHRKSKAIRTLERAAGPLTFGGCLRSIRLGEELTLAAFAAQLGVSRAHLCDIEQGRRTVGVERAVAWAHALGYHPAQFAQLALQGAVDAAGLRLQVTVESV